MDKVQFSQLFSKEYGNFCRYAFSIVNDKDEVEDIVQSVFVEVWNSGKIQQTDKPERYIIRSIKFKCIDYQRKAIVKRKHEAEVIHLTNYNVEENEDESMDYLIPLLNAEIAKLPEKTKKVFTMAKQEGKSYKTIAEEMNISPKTVENQITRAFKQLRGNLAKYKEMYYLLIFYGIG